MAGRREGPLMRATGSSSRGSRIAGAVAVGVLIGCIFAFLKPEGLFRSSNGSGFGQIYSTSCSSSSARIETLESQLAILTTKNQDLNSQVNSLSAKLQHASQGKNQILLKAGPFGSVRAFTKNPTVLPNESLNPKLFKFLQQIAINNELIVALANLNVHDMLELWSTNIKKVGIKNFLVVALDSSTEQFCKNNYIPVYNPDSDSDSGIDSKAKSGGNHQVSGLKFRILREFLQLGYSVLLSDIDIIYIQNPFDYLYRDSDVESMTDGHTNMTAYGYDDVYDDASMGWSRYAHTMRIWVFNSGFFYIRPTIPGIELLDRVAGRLLREPKAWDQAVFNEELFFPSRPGVEGLYASRRVMDYYLFMNSKVLFRTVRKDEQLRKLKPVIVHVNYHPDKFERAKAVVEFYVEGKKNALDKFPDGSQ